jgi:glycosyltransferase involved in cell wall biosynthesis
MKVSIIIPAFNEEQRIESIFESLKDIRFPHEVVIVLNGCTDGTKKLLENLQIKHSNIRFLDYPEKLGKGGAIREGFSAARGDIIGFVDADDAFDMARINQLIHLIDNGKADCAIASKWKGQSFFSIDEPFFKKILGRGLNLFVRLFFRLSFEDTQAGAKFLRREVFHSVRDNLQCSGFEFDAELLFRFQQRKYKIEEIFIPSRYLKGTTFRMMYVPEMFYNLLKLWARRKKVFF